MCLAKRLARRARIFWLLIRMMVIEMSCTGALLIVRCGSIIWFACPLLINIYTNGSSGRLLMYL